jgi:SAM-dependent methyltransferase
LARDAFPETRLIGLDRNVKSLLNSREHTDCLITGDLRWLPFGTGSLDAIFTRDTLECIAEPAAAIGEMVRTLTTGGVLLACHWDWDTQVFNADDLALTRTLVHAFADTQQGWMEHFDPAMGRKLRGLFALVPDCEVIDYGVVVLAESEWNDGRFGYEQSQLMVQLLVERRKIGPADADRWLHLLEEAEQAERYFYSINHYWCLVRKQDASGLDSDAFAGLFHRHTQ